MKFPPPPSEPPPPNVPIVPSVFKLPSINRNENISNKSTGCNKEIQTVKDWNTNSILDKTRRECTFRAVSNNKKLPQKPVLPSLPKAKALYDYNPQDLDELELKVGDIVEILKQRKS